MELIIYIQWMTLSALYDELHNYINPRCASFTDARFNHTLNIDLLTPLYLYVSFVFTDRCLHTGVVLTFQLFNTCRNSLTVFYSTSYIKKNI